MTPGRASETAQFTTILRAHHHLFGGKTKILQDDLALALSGLPNPEAVLEQVGVLVDGFSQLGSHDAASAFVEQTEHAVCARSRLFEERIKQLNGNGLQQLVILGAGMDTTAYRFSEALQDITVFEIDHPDTQAFKRQRLQESGIAIPSNLQFAGFDFENQTLAKAMEDSAIDRDKHTLFSWLGVSMYLTDDTVKATLGVLGHFPAGSELVMDYMPDLNGDLEEVIPKSVAELTKKVSEMGEPMLSRYNDVSLGARLHDAGFAKVDIYGSDRIVSELLGGDRSAYCMPEDTTSLLSATI